MANLDSDQCVMRVEVTARVKTEMFPDNFPTLPPLSYHITLSLCRFEICLQSLDALCCTQFDGEKNVIF